jgi:hypothetical protein
VKRGLTILFTATIVWISCAAGTDPEPPASRSGMVDFLNEYLEAKYSKIEFNDFLYVAARRQRLYHVRDNQIVARYVVSTSKFGTGGEERSHKTPLGLHKIYNKYGDNVPEGGIMQARKYMGREADIVTEPRSVGTDDVTTRVMWLRGTEQGINKGDGYDSLKRCIYIHGTPEEGLIGTPASHGCVRMRNEDILQLYDLVEQGTYVLILDN